MSFREVWGLILLVLLVSFITPINAGPNTSSDLGFNVSDFFIPSGLMGDYDAITLTDGFLENNNNSNESPNLCTQIIYLPNMSTRGNGWVGVYWQYPEGNWGNYPGYNLSEYSMLSFRARGENGGEVAEFKFGGIFNTSKQYHDSVNPEKTIGKVPLTKEWKPYQINLKGEDLSSVIGGFCWTTSFAANPKGCIIYIDDITLT